MMNAERNMRLHATIQGHVQGVGFRVFVQQYAANLNLTGWVRNTYRGDVEVLAEGSRAVLEKLLQLLEAGPRSSHVIQVNREWSDASGEFYQFAIERTA
ncbi:MAG: acylphosphatase [Bellilinea sp.]